MCVVFCLRFVRCESFALHSITFLIISSQTHFIAHFLSFIELYCAHLTSLVERFVLRGREGGASSSVSS